MADVYRQLLDDNIDVKPGAHQLLAYLEKMQIPRAVATSSSGSKARAILDRVGLWQYIPHLTGGDEVKAGKPAPDVYLDAAEKLGVNAPRCIAFEDSETGISGACRWHAGDTNSRFDCGRKSTGTASLLSRINLLMAPPCWGLIFEASVEHAA